MIKRQEKVKFKKKTIIRYFMLFTGKFFYAGGKRYEGDFFNDQK